jgi:calcineurin-like phosphoesterase family protein
MKFGGLNIYLKHTPPNELEKGPLEEQVVINCDLVLCGHVHNRWKWRIIFDTPIINVGMDVWDFEPVSLGSILKLHKKIIRAEEYIVIE